ncbi:MAG: UDP-glucose 4-epimerase GalE [Patescibacteria group bacterium]|nr:UDP-glucose 4-epimerase GalE [Patescibacteria group bacterium]
MGKIQPLNQKKAEPRSILVTGGAGNIGSHTGKLLTERGYQVTTLDNLSSGNKEFSSGHFVEGDLADQQLLDDLFASKHFDAVVHFAASIEVEESVKDPGLYYRNNVVNGLNLLSAMVKHRVPHLVFSSTCVVYDEGAKSPIAETAPLAPTSPYGETKLVFENMLKWFGDAFGMSSISLRYFNAAGASFDATLGFTGANPTHLIPSALNVALGKKDGMTVFGNDYKTQDGTAVRDFIHVMDLAEAHILALEHLFSGKSREANEVFNLGTGRGYSVLEIINAVCERTGHMVNFEIGPRRPGDREAVVADARKAKSVLGFEAKYSDLKTIIDTAWTWHKKYFGVK